MVSSSRTSVLRGIVAGIGLLSTISCASLRDTEIPRTNILMVNPRGLAVDPTDSLRKRQLEKVEYKGYISDIFADLNTYCAHRNPCKVLFFFHGGLNSRNGSLKRAANLQGDIRNSGSYPIFVNWRSSLPSSWWDHVAHVHKGIRINTVALFPYFAAVDEAKSIVEAPLAWYAEVRHTFPNLARSQDSIKAYTTLVGRSNCEPNCVNVNNLLEGGELADDRKLSDKLASYSTLPLTFPTKILAPPLLIQAAGTGAWNIMQRRTAVLLRTEDELRGNADASPAALAQFLDRFQKEFLPAFCQSRQEQVPCRKHLEVTLVGHSMGALVIDEVLRKVPDLEVKNIVFMAAATTVNDYHNTIEPYLKQHPDTQMFHLVLHPRAEVSERGFLDLSPRGSLLVWIDNYFTDPITPRDRTVGRFTNLLPELLTTEEAVRPRVHLKVFRVGHHVCSWNPQKHGDFGHFPFWNPAFWNPAVPGQGEKPPYARLDFKGCISPG